ncbi:unnamed protein product [Rotaria magnacalcarata]|uniref:COMM domain-containing protein 3 n=1 Tax=Rotaria magnacalcarata TaxID=392030 RepID=A0A816PHS0_9BILA|nr:unnamed protein product [Rotaria magnacalcarata]CAF1603719.1 unnamed protein product [Rotaria magnacalcarata]CAF2048143.1 unnamed protein product [Rotaria magnacalcarata]CAF2048529.1 unnamed protein product [Rotaria magnacalcarata]CAF2139998.1 unnamed protein product [Rotaria magnacalcarata]
MELNSGIEEDFRRLNNSTFIVDSQYEEFIDKIFSIFASANSNIEFSTSFDKRLVSSILTFIFECVKYDFDETSIRTKLDDLQFTNKIRQDRFLNQFNQHLSVIQLYLKQKSIEHDRLLDVNWRLDLQLKTNYTDKLLQPIYILDWTKREKYTTKIDHIQFSCSQESLQELLEKLKDAQSVLHQMQYQQQTKK